MDVKMVGHENTDIFYTIKQIKIIAWHPLYYELGKVQGMSYDSFEKCYL